MSRCGSAARVVNLTYGHCLLQITATIKTKFTAFQFLQGRNTIIRRRRPQNELLPHISSHQPPPPAFQCSHRDLRNCSIACKHWPLLQEESERAAAVNMIKRPPSAHAGHSLLHQQYTVPPNKSAGVHTHLAPCSARITAKYSNPSNGTAPLLKSSVFMTPTPS